MSANAVDTIGVSLTVGLCISGYVIDVDAILGDGESDMAFV